MKSLLLMSVFLATLVIPALAARDHNPRRGVRRMLFWLLFFNIAYVAYLTLGHPVLFVPKW
jgi:hypothetical protein